MQTLNMDVWGPAHVSGQSRERYFLLVVDDYTRYTTVFPLCSKGQVVDVLIPWIRTIHLQLRERFGQDLPILRLHSNRGGEFSSTLLRDFCRGEGILQSFTLPESPQQNGIAEHRIGLVMEVARTSMIHAAAPHFLWPFAVRYAAHQLNLWPRVSLPETSPTLRWTGKVGDASVFRVWGSRAFVRNTSADKLSTRAIPCGPAPSGVSQVDPLLGLALLQVAVDSGAARGAASGGAESEGAETGGAEPGGVEIGGAEPGGVATGGGEPGGAEPEGVEPGGVILEGAESGGEEPGGAALSGGSACASPRLSPQQLREARGPGAAAGAGVTRGTTTTGPGSARTRGTGAAGTGGVEGARAGAPTEPGAAGAGGTGAGGAGAGGAGAAGVGAVDPGAGGTRDTVRPRPYFVPLLQQSGGLTKRLEPASRPFLPVRTARRVPRSRPLPVLGTHAMALRPSSVPLHVPLPAPPESSLLEVPDPESDCARAASPTVARLLATAVTDPSFESNAVSALVAELLDFAAACRLDYTSALVAESASARKSKERSNSNGSQGTTPTPPPASGLLTEEDMATRPRASSSETPANQAAAFNPDMMENFFSFMSFYEQHQQGAPAQSNNSNDNATPMSLDGSSYARGNQQQRPTFAPYEPQRGSVSFMPHPQLAPGQEKTLDALQVQSQFAHVLKMQTSRPFDGKDFFTWSFEFELMMEGAQILGFFDGSLPYPTNGTQYEKQQYTYQSMMAYTILLRNITPTQQHNIRSYQGYGNSAELAYNHLKSLYQATDSVSQNEADWDEQNVDNASDEAGPLPYCSVPIPMDDENPRECVNAETYFDLADTGYVTLAEVNTNEAERVGPNFIPDPEDGDEAAYPEDTTLPRYTESGLQILGLVTAVHGTNTPKEPATVQQALGGEHKEKWREAMDKELKALQERNTWKVVPIGVARNKTILTGKWVFRVKTKADGTIDKFKARWVVRGFDQEHGRDFTETFAPVSRHTSLRILLAVAAMKRKKLRQIDVANAFLYSPVDAEIYVELPHGSHGEPNQVCQLQKSLYGIKQAPRLWQQYLHARLTRIGFKQLPHDQGMYRLTKNDDYILLIVYVDDLLYIGSNDGITTWFEGELQRDLTLTVSSIVTQYLGLNIREEKDAIYLSAEKHADTIAKRFTLTPSAITTPYRYTAGNDKGGLLKPAGIRDYQKKLGCLLFAAVTCRPDLSYSASQLATYLKKPEAEHLAELDRALHYFASTPTIGLTYYKNAATPTKLIGYVDADHAGDSDNRRSRTGYIYRLEPIGPISWQSSKQELIALSSAEAEYIALCVKI
ncbi:unnamed protein product [Closterium sp. NIES-54]